MSPQSNLDDANLIRLQSGGIYPIRDLPHTFDKRSPSQSDVEVASDLQKIEVQEQDIRRKQVGSNWASSLYRFWLTISTGVRRLGSVWVASHCSTHNSDHLTRVGLPTNLLASSTATSVQVRYMCIRQPSPRTLLTMTSWEPSLSLFGPSR